MFLTKIAYDRRRWDVVHDIDDRDRLHKKMLKLFPNDPAGGRDDARAFMSVLFRVEEKFILLQSKLAPKPTRISQGYVLEGTKDVTNNYASVREGAAYQFRLDANTSMKVPVDGGEWIPNADRSTLTRVKVRRIGCGNFAERRRWFEMRMERCGIDSSDFVMESLPVVRAKGVAYEATRFEGRLTVERLEDFRRAIEGGIGQGKAYGLGMISIRSV